MMPEMDGFEFLVELRSRAEWRDIPVLVVTAKDLTGGGPPPPERRVERVLQKERAAAADELLSEIGAALLPGCDRRAAGAARSLEANGMKILYVEDNDDNVYVLKNRLSGPASRCVIARTARRAWRWRAPSSPI